MTSIRTFPPQLGDWAVGEVSSYTFGGFIHVLVALAIAVLVVRMVKATAARPKATRRADRLGGHPNRPVIDT